MAIKKNPLFRSAGITAATVLLLTGSNFTASAQPEIPENINQVAQVAVQAVPGAEALATSTATEQWKHSSMTRTIEVKGKPGPAVVKPGDVLKYTVTYKADSFFTQEGIVSLTDVKPAGLTYVPGSASYTIGTTKADGNKANEWLTLENGAVKFTGSWANPYRSTNLEFTWEYQVGEDFAVGKQNTGMIVDWVSSADSNLSDMGPFIERKEEPKLPLPGLDPNGKGGISPSLGSPSLPKFEWPASLSLPDSPSLPSPSLPSPSAK